MDVAELGDEDLLLLQVLPSGALRLSAAGGQGHALLVHVARGQQVQSGRRVVDVQQGLVGVGDAQAVLGGVVLVERLVQLRGREGTQRAEVVADFGHVEVLGLVYVPVGRHHDGIAEFLLLELELVVSFFRFLDGLLVHDGFLRRFHQVNEIPFDLRLRR